MTPINTITIIVNQRKRELLKSHRALILKYFNTKKDFHHTTVKRIMKYYDSQVNEDNIDNIYHQPIQLFLTNLFA